MGEFSFLKYLNSTLLTLKEKLKMNLLFYVFILNIYDSNY